MRVSVRREESFDAAHKLLHVPAGHQCGNLHGHTYRVMFELSCDSAKLENGMVLDFGLLKNVVKKLDHGYLNETMKCEDPTAENICVWLFHAVSQLLFAMEIATDVRIDSIEVWETPKCSAKLVVAG